MIFAVCIFKHLNTSFGNVILFKLSGQLFLTDVAFSIWISKQILKQFALENIKIALVLKKKYSCAKYYIFLCKCRKTIPTFLCFKHYLSSRIDIEEQIAFQQDKLEQHKLKWKMFIPLTKLDVN